MFSTSSSRVFGGASSNVVNFGSASDIDDMPNSGFHGCFIVYRTADNTNRWIAQKGASPNGWQFLHNNFTGFGQIRLLVRRGTTLSDTRSTNAIPLNTPTVVAFSWDPTAGGKLFMGGITGTVSECGYSAQTVGVGSYLTDASADLLVGNDAAGGAVFEGEIERCGVGTGTITAAQVQAWRDTALAQGDLLLAYMGSGSPEPDYSGHSRTGAVTGTATTSARDPVHIIEPTDLWDTQTPTRYNQYAANEYIFRSSFSAIKLNCTATLVDVTSWLTYVDGTRASMTCVCADRDGAYGGQIKYTGAANSYGRGTITLSAGSVIEVLTGPRSRRAVASDGSDPQQGTFPVTLRFSTSGAPVTPTLVSPSAPSVTEIIVSDSIGADGFTGDPALQHAQFLQRRRAIATRGRRVAFDSFGGKCAYHICKDATARSNFVTRIGEFSGSNKLVYIELGANDWINSLWSPSSLASGLSSLITDLKAMIPVPQIIVACPLLTGIEGSSFGGFLIQDFRDAILALAPIGGVTFINSKTYISSGNLNADTIHATNTGLDELYTNFNAAFESALPVSPNGMMLGIG